MNDRLFSAIETKGGTKVFWYEFCCITNGQVICKEETFDMVAYEFYWRDPIKGYQIIGKFPERRTDPTRITQESIMNCGKKILGENVNENDIFFIEITMDKNTDKIFQFNLVYKPLIEF